MATSTQCTCRCSDTLEHLTRLRLVDGVWDVWCRRCSAKWTEPVVESDASTIAALNGGRPQLRLVAGLKR